MLCVGGGLAEQNGAGAVLDVVAAARHGLAVGLHRELLQVGWESMQVLVESVVFSASVFVHERAGHISRVGAEGERRRQQRKLTERPGASACRRSRCTTRSVGRQ